MVDEYKATIETVDPERVPVGEDIPTESIAPKSKRTRRTKAEMAAARATAFDTFTEPADAIAVQDPIGPSPKRSILDHSTDVYVARLVFVSIGFALLALSVAIVALVK